MKTTIILLLLVLAVGTAVAQTNSAPSALLGPTFARRHEPPAVSLLEAVSLAEAFMRTNTVSTNGYWIGEARLRYSNGTDARATRWEIRWITASMGLGNAGIRLCVDMERHVWRDEPMKPSAQQGAAPLPPAPRTGPAEGAR